MCGSPISGSCRLDHWIKNILVLPGVVIGLTVDPARIEPGFILTLLVGFLAVGLIFLQ